MIIYNRNLEKEDIVRLDDDEELIFFRDNNIAFVVNQVDNKYVLRKKKIFNNELISERFLKTVEQIIKVIQ